MSIYEPGEILKKRKQLGLTQTELARKAGTSQVNISKIEKGTINPSYEMLEKITRALKKETIDIDIEENLRKYFVWTCPHCGEKIKHARKEKIKQFAEDHLVEKH